MKSFNGISLCANIYERADLFAQKPYVIHQTNEGIKIAIIGLTTDYIPHWESPGNIENLNFKPVINTLRLILEDIKKHSIHAIVVAYHGGFEKDLDSFKLSVKDTKENVGSLIIESFPEIDVLLTGHQHRMISRNIRNVSVSQPGSRASFFSLVHMSFEKKDDWALVGIDHSLQSVEDHQADNLILKLIEKEENFTQNKLNEVIGHVTNGSYLIENQIQARITKHPIVSLLNHIQLQISGAMVSCVSLANEASGFNPSITIRDVFATYPYPNTLSVVKISGKELRLALEENAQFFTIKEGQITIDAQFTNPKKQLYNYDMFDGIEYTINVSRPIGQRITSLTRNHQPIHDSNMFTLVLNNYRVAGGGDFEIFKHLEVIKDIPNDVGIIIIDYIQKHQAINYFDHKNIKLTM
jgi:2',3'-cyclic-nucleotide 2'-phosphodiesterase/3'-nucleotidase